MLAVSSPGQAETDEEQNRSRNSVNVFQYGAQCNGTFDDTAAFRRAMAAAPAGGVVNVPAGNCRLTDTVTINGSRPVSLVGSGRGSQIFQASNKTLLQLVGVNAVTIKDLYLGSAATAPGAALIQLTNSHHNRIDNVTMLGGYSGLYLQGSLLNTVVDLRSGVNFGGFFGPASVNKYWVYGERFGNISSNANTFLAPVLEGGTNGIYLKDTNGEGSLSIVGGAIEGVSGTALKLEGTFLPSAITGVHFEANGVEDVVLQKSSNVRLSSILSIKQINVLGDSRNVTISDSMAQNIFIDVAGGAKRIILQNITAGFASCGPLGVIPAPGAPGGGSGAGSMNPLPDRPDIIYTNIANYCGGQ